MSTNLEDLENKAKSFIERCRSIRDHILSENVSKAPLNASDDSSNNAQLNEAESALASASGFGN